MKDLKFDDYLIIKPYLDMANYEGYNSNFITMMMWNHEYHIQYEIHQHFMVMLHNYKGIKFWAMPFTTPDYYYEAINFMINYSKTHCFDFMIDCAIEEFVDHIRIPFHQELLFERTEYNDDYIYDRQMMQTLSGKKMQKRRNHFNSLKKDYPEYFYRELDSVLDFDMILKCLNKWENTKDNLSESVSSEIRGILSLLSFQDVLDYKAGGIFINGQMEAFIIGSRLNHSTIQIHVEKANKAIRGLYPAILKEFLEHHFPDEQYINREEDMGLENLRKSKQALHPLKMIHKYRITLKQPEIRIANNDDFEQIYNLWLNRFEDENEESAQYYFQNIYQKNNTYIYENNEKIISVIQIIPMELKIKNQVEECYFILGVCTDKRFEGQGCMKELLQFILNQFSDKRIYLQAYIPEIYYSFGFSCSHLHCVTKLDRSILTHFNIIEPINDYTLLKAYYDDYTSCFDEYRIRTEEYFHLLIKRCQVFNQRILIFKDLGYLIYEENDQRIYISELIYLNNNAIYQMLAYFKSYNKEIVLETDMKVNIQGESHKIITMLSNQENKECCITQKYINEIY